MTALESCSNLESSSGIQVLTADEEATILAKYGVKGPFDDMLDLPADSKFHSDISGPSIFLTGATVEDEGIDLSPPREVLESGGVGDRQAPDSLRSILIKETTVFRDFSSVFLLNRTSELLDEIDHLHIQGKKIISSSTRYQNGINELEKNKVDPNGQKYVETLLNARKYLHTRSQKIDSLDMIASNENPNPFLQLNNNDDDDDRCLMENVDELMRKADTVFALPKHFDPSSDLLFQQNIKAHKLFSKANGPDELDDYLERYELLTEDEEEKENEAILLKSHAVVEKIAQHFSKENIALNVSLGSEFSVEKGLKDSPPILRRRGIIASEGDLIEKGRELHKEIRSTRLEPLFSFEIEPTHEEVKEVAAWDPLIEQAESKIQELERAEAERKYLHDETVMGDVNQIRKRCHSILLEPMNSRISRYPFSLKATEDMPELNDDNGDGIEQVLLWYDKKMEEVAEKNITDDQERRHVLKKMFSNKNNFSQVQLQPIEQVVDRLLPSTAQEVLYGMDAISPSTEVEGVCQKKKSRILYTSPMAEMSHKQEGKGEDNVQIEPGEVRALHRLGVTDEAGKALRKARIQLFLLAREEAEFRLMRAESLRMEKIVREQEIRREEMHHQMLKIEEEYDNKRENILQDEIFEWKTAGRRKADHYSFTLKAIEMRRINAILTQSCQLQQECTSEYGKIVMKEALEFKNIFSRKIEEEKAVLQQIESRKRHEEDALRCRWRECKKGYLRLKKEGRERNAMRYAVAEKQRQACRKRTPIPPFLLTSRLAFFYEEQKKCCAWYKSKNCIFENIEKSLKEKKGLRVNQSLPSRDKWSVACPALDQTCSRSAEKESEDNKHVDLNADRLSTLLPLAFTAVKTNPFAAPHYFRTLSLPLENISAIDYTSLGKMIVPSNDFSTAKSPHSFAMKRLSRRELHFGDLVREVNLSSNELEVISLHEFLQVFPFLEKLELTRNKLTRLSSTEPIELLSSSASRSVRGFKAAQENGMAEQFLLKEVDISSNSLQDIAAIGKLLSSCMQVLLAHSNQLRTVKPLITCLKLEKLNLSKNRIESVDELSHLHLLRELDLADNCLKNVDSVFSNNVLLQKLYVSRNSIRQLSSSGSPTLLFLTELFINECEIQSLEYKYFPALPSLTILHANSNKIRRISGLRRCPRLSIIQLADNNIDRLEELGGIIFCQSLTSLDVSGNPFLLSLVDKKLVEKEKVSFPKEEKESDNPFFPEIEHFLIRFFPSLREFNRSSFPSPLYWKYVNSAHLGHSEGGRTDEVRLEKLWASVSWDGMRNSQSDNSPSLPMISTLHDALRTYRNTLATISMGILFGHIQHNAEVMEVREKQQLRAALSLEERLHQRAVQKKKDYLPVVHGLSSAVHAQYRRHQQETIKETIKHFRNITHYEQDMEDGQRTLEYCTNHHVQLPTYAQKALAFQQKRARTQIEAWIYKRVLIRRAKEELRRRREVYKVSREYKWSCSVKIIQRVGRGAIVRKRLRNIQQEDLLDNLEENLLEELDLPSQPVVPEDFRSIVGGVLQRMPPEAKLKFEVPESSVFFCPHKAKQVPLPVDLIRGPSSAPNRGTGGSGSGRVVFTPRSEGGTSKNKALVLEEEWGAQVANQILKKNEKRSRETRKIHREQYMQNPLRFKKGKMN